MNRLIVLNRLIVFMIMTFIFSAVYAEETKVIIPTTKNLNYTIYPASTGVFLRLDTRDGTIQGIVPSDPKKNRVLNSQPLALDKKPGRFELYPTDSYDEWLLLDTDTGDMWLLDWRAKGNKLSKIPVQE